MAGEHGKTDADKDKQVKAKADRELNEELKQTFPASDPLTVTRAPADKHHSDEAKGKREIEQNKR
ncbi:hypothetical protein PY365_29310 [Roseiarcaceae bacterium H3SJ34-1]|uniref:hypothetical protein n=1 Tax=Terripilifer ovatus TaxID=3032367 RepID=UPI003AB96314|nr:hypothetical protein [Roseiarcaceae bacterium H3SJ34-1]